MLLESLNIPLIKSNQVHQSGPIAQIGNIAQMGNVMPN